MASICDVRTLGRDSHLDRRPCQQYGYEVLSVKLIDSCEVLQIGQEDSYFDEAIQNRPGGLDDAGNIPQTLVSPPFDITYDEVDDKNLISREKPL